MDSNIQQLKRKAEADPSFKRAYHTALIRKGLPLPMPPYTAMSKRNKQRYWKHMDHMLRVKDPKCRFCRRNTNK